MIQMFTSDPLLALVAVLSEPLSTLLMGVLLYPLLTAIVWKRGWRWYALLPVVLIAVIGFWGYIFIGGLALSAANIAFIIIQITLIIIGERSSKKYFNYEDMV